MIRHALIFSLILVLISGSIGYIFGVIAKNLFGSPNETTIRIFQVFGALILLWGTLFVRGWHIQTYSGVTFSERVNQWIYRALYCLGTTIIIFSLAWTWNTISGERAQDHRPPGVIADKRRVSEWITPDSNRSRPIPGVDLRACLPSGLFSLKS